MSNAIFPATIFTTQRRFDDYSSDDMRYGGISEGRLKKDFDRFGFRPFLTNMEAVIEIEGKR